MLIQPTVWMSMFICDTPFELSAAYIFFSTHIWMVRMITNTWSENQNPIFTAGHQSVGPFGQRRNNKPRWCCLWMTWKWSPDQKPGSTAVWQGLLQKYLFIFIKCLFKYSHFGWVVDVSRWDRVPEAFIALGLDFAGNLFSSRFCVLCQQQRCTAPTGGMMAGCHIISVYCSHFRGEKWCFRSRTATNSDKNASSKWLQKLRF